MLRKDQQSELSIDQPVCDVQSAIEVMCGEAETEPTALPQSIGRYRIIGVLGSGGMGTVYEAEQDNPRRRVALKAIRRGVRSRAMVRRFQQEAQLLGRLQHPCIAQVLEAGSGEIDGEAVPYLVMELVQGRPLLEFASHHRLDRRMKLELIALICDAVQHAHEHDVIHRDLKPANILVVDRSRASTGQADASPASPSHGGTSLGSFTALPKILDFGVARATDSDVQAVTLQTSVGQLIGTVPYMSPEQAAGDPSQVDWRTDVYALGVIAFELLTGRLPHDVRDKLAHEALRVIRENEPSRLGSVDRALRGDLETILDKALAHEKDRRYQSAAALAADLRRFLRDEPILARPPSAIYQLRKFARRNKALVSGVAIAFLAMSLATVFSVRQAIIANRALAQEQRLREIADERTAEAERQTYRANLVAASSALRYNEIADARRLLDAAPPALRGWEWKHLDSRLDDSVMRLDVPFTPTGMAISPDGRTFAAGGSAGLIGVWSVPDMTSIASIRLEAGFRGRHVMRMYFSADGSELHVIAQHGAYRLDARTLDLLERDDVPARARSDDGRYCALIEDGDTDRVRIVETASERVLVDVNCANAFNSIMVFTPDAAAVAICLRGQGGLTMYDTSDGRVLCHRPDLDDVAAVEFSADGSRAAVAMQTGGALIIDTRTGSDLVALAGHTIAVTRIAYSSDESLLATVSADRGVRLWNTSDGSPVSVMHGHTNAVSHIAFTEDDAMVVTASADGMIRWWDAKAPNEPFTLPTPGTVYGVAFTPDGRRIVAACLYGDHPLRIWDASTGREIFAGSEGNLSSLAVSADGSRLAVGRSGSTNSTIHDLDGQQLGAVGGHWWRTNWLAFQSNDEQLLSLGNGGRLLTHDVVTGTRLERLNFPAESTGEGCRAAISPDESLLAIASNSMIHLVDGQSRQVQGRLVGDSGKIYALAFSPDGQRLVSGSSDRLLRIWDVQGKSLMATLASHSSEIYAVAFTNDGSRLVSAGRDRTIRVWDTERWEEITQLHGHTSLVYCLAFSPDGATLASGGGDEAVRLWGTSPWSDVVEARK
jgi:WD40 repeat protein/serine/threonine protein kinase